MRFHNVFSWRAGEKATGVFEAESPVVQVPEELQVEVVDVVVDLLPVALHQLCVAHQFFLQTEKLGEAG